MPGSLKGLPHFLTPWGRILCWVLCSLGGKAPSAVTFILRRKSELSRLDVIPRLLGALLSNGYLLGASCSIGFVASLANANAPPAPPVPGSLVSSSPWNITVIPKNAKNEFKLLFIDDIYFVLLASRAQRLIRSTGTTNSRSQRATIYFLFLSGIIMDGCIVLGIESTLSS